MSRNSKIWTATYGRDAGKRFLITEMSSDATEKWAIRAVLAIAAAGGEVPEGSLTAGAAGLAAIFRAGLFAIKGLQYPAVAPLLDEMMSCVQMAPAQPGLQPTPLFHEGENASIEEVRTRFALRAEIVELHLGFSVAGVLSTIRGTSATSEAQTE